MAAEHVVMLVHNSVVNDTRVLREAAWLARAGLQVTVLGRSASAQRDIVPVDRALVARLPLVRDLALAQKDQRARRRAWRPVPPPLGTVADREGAAELDLVLRESSKLRDEQAGPGARVGRRSARLVRRGAVAASARLDDTMGRLWSEYDLRRSHSTRLVRWRTVVGGVVGDYERAYGPVIDHLRPDVVHAHDVHMLGVAVHAARRARRHGRDLKVVYDSHEFVPGMAVVGRTTPRTIAGWQDLERRYVHEADEIITVGDDIATLIQDHHDLRERPRVVLNVPVPAPTGVVDRHPRPDVRAACGLGPDVPLLVYSGGVSAVRGVDTAVQGLALLPGVHLAVVCVPGPYGPVVEGLRETARELGCEDRLHLLEPVPPGRIVDHLRTADVGLIVMHGGWPNHEHAMPNKFFEYLRAGVPLVVSDLRCLGREVRTGGLGATFEPKDVDGFATAVRAVLEDLEGARERVRASPWRRQGDWRVQESRLRAAYEPVLGRALPQGQEDLAGGGPLEPIEEAAAPDGRVLDARPLDLVELPDQDVAPESVRLVLGPRNLDGGMSALAAAVRRESPGLEVRVTEINPPQDREVELPVRRTTYHRALGWQLTAVRGLLWGTTHALFEDCRPLAGTAMGPTCLRECRYLVHLGVACGVLLHEPPPDVVRADLADLQELGVALLVSTPELLGAVPGARWLPRVDDGGPAPQGPGAGSERRRRGARPVVLPADHTGRLLCRDAARAGLVEVHDGAVDALGLPVAGTGPVDAVVLGGEEGVGGATAVRTMAAGTLLVAGAQTPGPWLPLVDDVQDLDWALRLQDVDACDERAAAGPDWVREHHTGAFSVRVLRHALALPEPVGART